VDGRPAAGSVIGPCPRRARMELARPRDASGIATLLAEPMPGSLRLSLLEPEQRCVPCEQADRRHAAVVFCDDAGRIVGHGARTVRRLRLRGQGAWIGYLHGLRRTQALAGDGRRLAAGIAHLCSQRRSDEAPHDFTAILEDNRCARRVLEGGLPGAPRYHPLGEYDTRVIDAGASRSWSTRNLQVRPLPAEAVSAAQLLQELNAAEYSPEVMVSTHWLSAWRGDQLVGLVQPCDRRTKRRELVAGYAPWLHWLRPLANLGLTCLGRPRLPPPGSVLDLVYAAHLTVPAGEADVVRALVTAVACASSARLVVVGLARDHALAKAAATLPAWRIASRIYAVGAAPAAPCGIVSPEAGWL
jgi:hypothetical protein